MIFTKEPWICTRVRGHAKQPSSQSFECRETSGYQFTLVCKCILLTTFFQNKVEKFALWLPCLLWCLGTLSRRVHHSSCWHDPKTNAKTNTTDHAATHTKHQKQMLKCQNECYGSRRRTPLLMLAWQRHKGVVVTTVHVPTNQPLTNSNMGTGSCYLL